MTAGQTSGTGMGNRFIVNVFNKEIQFQLFKFPEDSLRRDLEVMGNARTAGPPLPRGITKGADPLRWLQIETDLKREMRENIAHQRMMGSYVGKRHAMGLPVRGQNTQTNAKTARKLNRVERHR